MKRITGECPLGSKCEEYNEEEKVLVTCPWYVCIKGKDPQSEEQIDKWGCSLAWLPILLVENAQTNRGQTDAICSLRDETITRQDMFNRMINRALGQAAGKRMLE